MILYAVARSGEPLAPAMFSITLQPSSDGTVTYTPCDQNTHLGDYNANTVLPLEDIYILDSVAPFEEFNQNRKAAG